MAIPFYEVLFTDHNEFEHATFENLKCQAGPCGSLTLFFGRRNEKGYQSW